eukprot:574141-Prymnesium_polylepis.1
MDILVAGQHVDLLVAIIADRLRSQPAGRDAARDSRRSASNRHSNGRSRRHRPPLVRRAVAAGTAVGVA